MMIVAFPAFCQRIEISTLPSFTKVIFEISALSMSFVEIIPNEKGISHE
jgi:hypothetical protein